MQKDTVELLLDTILKTNQANLRISALIAAVQEHSPDLYTAYQRQIQKTQMPFADVRVIEDLRTKLLQE